MALDAHTAEERLTPEARRGMLRAFADRMLLKIAAMDDPEDLPGVERAVRTAAAIERIYSRCDRAEKHAPDPRKLEAERAVNAREAINARVHLAGTLEWGDKRRAALGKWWDAADTGADAKAQPLADAPAVPPATLETKAAPLAPAKPAARLSTKSRLGASTGLARVGPAGHMDLPAANTVSPPNQPSPPLRPPLPG